MHMEQISQVVSSVTKLNLCGVVVRVTKKKGFFHSMYIHIILGTSGKSIWELESLETL